MLLIRRFEEKAGQLYGMGLIGGFCHLYIGQEAIVVGMQMTLKPGDGVITGYSDHGHMLACGMDPKGVMAELTGRRGGYSRGKGGSMHMFSAEKGFFGGHGIVGAQVPLGTGLAFANLYRGNDNVSLTFGDGASSQGQVYEAPHGEARSYRSSTSSRTTNTVLGPRSHARRRPPSCFKRGLA
jgi:pyruvate dehydrogenase E1 component alpha subunit